MHIQQHFKRSTKTCQILLISQLDPGRFLRKTCLINSCLSISLALLMASSCSTGNLGRPRTNISSEGCQVPCCAQRPLRALRTSACLAATRAIRLLATWQKTWHQASLGLRKVGKLYQGKKKKENQVHCMFFKETYPAIVFQGKTTCALVRWHSEMGKSGHLFSSMIQSGKNLFEQRPYVLHNEKKPVSWHLHFALL